MRATFLCLVFLFIVPHIDAARAPAPVPNAKEKLEALKKRLPAVLEAWAKEQKIGYPFTYIPVLRRVRAIGNAEAKVVDYLHYRDDNGKVRDKVDYMLTVYLTYYEGLWTAVRFEWSYPDGDRSSPHADGSHRRGGRKAGNEVTKKVPPGFLGVVTVNEARPTESGDGAQP